MQRAISYGSWREKDSFLSRGLFKVRPPFFPATQSIRRWHRVVEYFVTLKLPIVLVVLVVVQETR